MVIPFFGNPVAVTAVTDLCIRATRSKPRRTAEAETCGADALPSAPCARQHSSPLFAPMGASYSSSVQEEATLPFPPVWLAEGVDPAAACAAVRASTARPAEHFLQAPGAALPELEPAAWGPAWDGSGLASFKVHATAAMRQDTALNRLAFVCVPKRCTEGEFWRCYFCWAHFCLVGGGMDAPRPRPTEQDLALQQHAEQQAESVEAMLAQYDEEVLEPARAELARVKAAYRDHLAESTDRAGCRASAASVKLAREYRAAIVEAERRYEEAREQMCDEVASLRSAQRMGRAWHE